MTRMFQGIFRRHETYVVVKRTRIGPGEYLEPGTEVTRDDFREYILRYWHKGRRIGLKGTLWVDAMLDRAGDTYARPEIMDISDEENSPDPEETKGDGDVDEDSVADQEDGGNMTQQDEMSPDEVPEENSDDVNEEASQVTANSNDDIEILQKGPWYYVYKNGEQVATHKGLEKLKAWLSEHGYSLDDTDGEK